MWDAILDDAKYWWKLVKANKENTFKEIACYKKAINGLENQHCLQQKSDDNT